MKDKTTITPPATIKGEALKLWRRYADELHTRNMLHEADLAALERLCRLEVQSTLLLSQIEIEGVIIKDRDGTQRRNPALMALQGLAQITEGLKRSLAIGGYYRHRIEGKEVEEVRPKSALMAMRNAPRPAYSPPNEETGT